MIDLKELRLGNWVNIMGTPHAFAPWGEYLDYEAYGEPIPLTPELLIKCGFDQDGVLLLEERGVCSLGWHLVSYKNYVNLGYDYDDCTYASHSSEYNYYIKYLHQLQNLYFALTGKELNIEP